MTRYGPVRTDHILFIAAGSFHNARPADLIPELQGRFPIRVELQSLSEDDLYAILTEPQNALTKQSVALLATEGVELRFEDDVPAGDGSPGDGRERVDRGHRRAATAHDHRARDRRHLV